MIVKDKTGGSMYPFNNYSWDYEGLGGKRHSAVIAAVVDLEPEDFQNDGFFQDKICICFQLEGKGKDKLDRVIPLKLTASIGEKAKLRRMLDDANLLAGFEGEGKKNTDWLVGKKCKVKVVMETAKKSGRQYPTVTQLIDDDNEIEATFVPASVDRNEDGTIKGDSIPI
jgi:hypothetical protein